jgi:DnaJ-class molecular chaperone
MSNKKDNKTRVCPKCNGDGVIKKGQDKVQCPRCWGSGFLL